MSNATFLLTQQTSARTQTVHSLPHSVLLAKSPAAVFFRERILTLVRDGENCKTDRRQEEQERLYVKVRTAQ